MTIEVEKIIRHGCAPMYTITGPNGLGDDDMILMDEAEAKQALAALSDAVFGKAQTVVPIRGDGDAD